MLGVGAFLGIGNALGFINYTVIWRYFSWTNQTLAMIVLWAASMYLFKEKKNYWITAVPATFMSAVSATYFVLAPECLGGLLNHKTAEGATVYNTAVAYPVGILFAIAMLALFIYATKKQTVKKDCIIDISPSSSIPIPIHNRKNRLPGRPAGGFCLCRETTNCGKKNRNADKVHKNMPKSLAGCTENEKSPAETISAKKFCRGYVKKFFAGIPGNG